MHVRGAATIDLLTYLQLYLLEVKHTQLWQFVDDIEPVMLLVCHWIPQQAATSLETDYRLHLRTFSEISFDCSHLRRLNVFTVASGSKSPWKERRYNSEE